MRILIACEYSGTVRDAFIRAGHDAMSCDLLDTDTPGPHYMGDIRDVLDREWDMMVAHPPCTYLASMGIWWNKKRPERWPLTYAARDFVNLLFNAPIDKICIENPIGYLSNNWRKWNQIVHPWQFGDEASKPTCLWLKNLPLLKPTNIVGKGEFYVKSNGARMAKWSHITSGTNKSKRAKIASTTFKGIADAMASQWS